MRVASESIVGSAGALGGAGYTRVESTAECSMVIGPDPTRARKMRAMRLSGVLWWRVRF